MNLDLCRDFCQALFDVRQKKDETADSVLRVSFELNNQYDMTALDVVYLDIVFANKSTAAFTVPKTAGTSRSHSEREPWIFISPSVIA